MVEIIVTIISAIATSIPLIQGIIANIIKKKELNIKYYIEKAEKFKEMTGDEKLIWVSQQTKNAVEKIQFVFDKLNATTINKKETDK